MSTLRLPLALTLAAIATIGAAALTSVSQSASATAPEMNLSDRAAATPPALTLSGRMPTQVPFPPGGLTPEQVRPWFDTFSFQEFIALSWPAVAGKRGVADQPDNPDAFRNAFKPNPQGKYPTVVWGTWKQAYELFEQGSQRPTSWSSFKAVLPCTNPLPDPPLTFLDDTANDINESFSFPLIDQQLQYTRYEIRLNEAEYEAIRGDDSQPSSWLYIQQNMINAQPINFPMSSDTKIGAVELKASWRPITSADDKGRYYIVNALVLDPITNTATYQQMGLVGFHIAQKTSPFTEWVWSTFEHVDNVKVGPNAPSGTKPSYNNGTNMPPTPKGYDKPSPVFPPMLPQGSLKAVQVTRINPIPTTPPMTSTVDLNVAFQKLVAGTVWQNYELIATQWPTDPASFKLPSAGGKYPADCGAPFPEKGVANTTAETYAQMPSLGTGNSCMQCHYLTAATDFSWVLALRAHPTVTPPNQSAFLAQRNTGTRALRGISAATTADPKKVQALRTAIQALEDARTKAAQP